MALQGGWPDGLQRQLFVSQDDWGECRNPDDTEEQNLGSLRSVLQHPPAPFLYHVWPTWQKIIGGVGPSDTLFDAGEI